VRGTLGHEDVAVAFDEGADDAEGSGGSGHREREGKWRSF